MSLKRSVIAAAAVLMTSGGSAQERASNVAAKPIEPTPEVLAVETAQLAYDLAAYGRETGNAMALIVAAEIQARVGARPADWESMPEHLDFDEYTAASEVSDMANDDSPEALLAAARELAGNDAALLAAIERASSLESRGRLHEGRPLYFRSRIEPRVRRWFTLSRRGGRPAAISVTGDGSTDLDLYVYDQNDNLVCRDIALTDRARCMWTPKWTGPFRIAVVNLGYGPNEFVMTSD